MKKHSTNVLMLWIAVSLLCFYTTNVYGQKTYQLKQQLTLQMPEGSGSNGAGVVYIPRTGIYLAAFAGNESFPMVSFNDKGSLLNEYEAGYDVRGFWYNKKAGEVQGNPWDREGIIGMKVNKKGMPVSYHDVNTTMVPPDENSCGVLNCRKQEVLFLDEDGTIIRYKLPTGEKLESIKLEGLNRDMMKNINRTSMIYTGKKKHELGLLDYVHHEIKLYNLKNGELQAVCKVPDKVDLSTAFNFSYANKLIWIFNKDERVWLGFSM